MHDTEAVRHSAPAPALSVRSRRRRRAPIIAGALLVVTAMTAGGVLIARTGPTDPPATVSADPPTTVSALPETARPQTTVLAVDANPVDLGLRFSVAVEGTVLGLRLYRGDDDVAARPARLWAPDGTVLAELRFAAPEEAGWQRALFDVPIPVQSGGTYTASYRATDGYLADAGYFSAEAAPDTGTLLRPDPVAAGVFGYGETTVAPTQSVEGTNYWIDVLFLPATNSVPSSAPTARSQGADALSVPQPGEVGFTGDRSALRVIDGAASAPAGTTWVNGTLRVDAATVTLDGVWVKGSVDYYGAGTLTIRNSVVAANGSSWAVVFGRLAAGTLDISDSTLTWPADVPAPGPTWGTGAVNGESRMILVRNDISGTVDGVQQSGGNSLFQQNYIHDLRMFGAYPNNSHNDGLQFYGGPNIAVLANHIELNGYDGTHQNAAVFFSDDGTGFQAPRVVGNYLSGGGFTLRMEEGTTDAVVTDNTFGPVAGGFGHVALQVGATLARWTDNVGTDGVAIAQPPAG